MTAPEPSWWGQLYDDEGAPLTADRPAPAPEPTGERRLNIRLTRTRPENEPLPDAARAMLPKDPRTAARARWLLYNASAAAAGWWLGIERFCAEGIAASGRTSVEEGVWVGVGLILAAFVLELAGHRFRGAGAHPIGRLIGWALRVPLASAALALALYGPDAAL